MRGGGGAPKKLRDFDSTMRPMAPKLSKMGTSVEGSSGAIPNDTSISWSRYKDIISSPSHSLWFVALAKDERT